MNVYPDNRYPPSMVVERPVAEQLAKSISDETNARIAADNVLRGIIDAIEVPDQGIGVAGFNLYPSTVNSDVSGYKKLAFITDDAETEISVTANSNTVFAPSYIMDEALNTTEIPAGQWAFNYYRKISSAAQFSAVVIEIFLRHAGGSETTVVSFESPELNDTEFTPREVSYVKNAIATSETDRLGMRIGLRTLRPTETTLTYIVGDGRGFFTRTPLTMLHNNLSGRDAIDAHPESAITNLVSDLAEKAPLNRPTFTGTVSGITKSMVGLGNVDNTSDATKFTSPALTGTPTAPTAALGTNTTQIASTAFVRAECASIIESGYVSGRGWYIKFGDGTMIQWVAVSLYAQDIGTEVSGTCAWPTPFYSLTSIVFGGAKEIGAGSQWLVGAQAYNGVYDQSSVSSAILKSYAYRISTLTGGSDYIRYNYIGIGRWRA